ncbi:MAG: hypothetical protein H6Q69_2560 [Firmicutes bacterium]|nr:hypothetical protein [Bacillota bacterium]
MHENNKPSKNYGRFSASVYLIKPPGYGENINMENPYLLLTAGTDFGLNLQISSFCFEKGLHFSIQYCTANAWPIGGFAHLKIAYP